MPIDSIIPGSAGSPRQLPDGIANWTSETTALRIAANEALQGIQDIFGRADDDASRVRFPRGYLIEIGRWRSALGFVRRNEVRNNVAYTLMMYDVQTWLLRRTDITATARDMIVKASIMALGSIVEAIVIDSTSPPLGRRQKMASRIEVLANSDRIASGVDIELNWLWETRNRLHLFELTNSEFSFYEVDHLPRAEAAVVALVQGLQLGAR